MENKKHPWEQIFSNKGWDEKEPFPRFFEVVEWFRDHGRKRLLELGCGNGRHLIQFLKEGFEVTGMDISISALRMTLEWAHSEGFKAKVFQADMRDSFPIRGGFFDGVFSTQVIHHARMVDIRHSIKEIYRVLREGGLAFITVSGRVDDGIGHEQIEPGTYMPLSGSEKGLPHHVFNEQELRLEFTEFHIEAISLRAGGRILAVLIRKPEVT